MDLDELESIARRELTRHGLRDWDFAFTNTKRRIGACRYRLKRIEIAEYYARNSPPETVLDTLRHEIAHAIAGPDARHGPAWKAVAIRVGATPRACETSDTAVVQPGDWQATCPSCEKRVHLYRRPASLGGYLCKCEARSPLTFEYKGDPSREPIVPQTPADAARWQATCSACGTVHLRIRRPRAGLWRCNCPRRQELAWKPRQ